MTDQEIIDSAPEGATHHVLENGTSFHFKIDDKEASIYTDEWDCYTNHKDVIPDLVGLRSLADIKRNAELEGFNVGLAEESCAQQKRIAELEEAHLKNDLLIMSNARRLIKAKARTSNGRLYSELFGAGMGTGRERCRKLGLDPDCNKTDCHSVIEALKEQIK